MIRCIALAVGLLVAALLVSHRAGFAAEPKSASLAEQAMAARCEEGKLAYEVEMAQRTVRAAEGVIKTSMTSLPQLREAVAKVEQEKLAAEKVLQEKTAAAEAAKSKAEKSGAEQDQAEAAQAEQARIEAERLLRQQETNYQREAGRLERSEEKLKQSEADLAEANRAIPEKTAAAEKARERFEQLKTQAVEANAALAKSQDPQAIADRIDAIIDARLKAAGIPASPPADDAEFFRRLSLDVTATIPKYDDVVAFLDDADADNIDSAKRRSAIDRALADAGFGRNFSQRFCTLTTEEGTSTLAQAQDNFNDWLAEGFNLNRRWDRVAADVLASDGVGYEQPGVLFTVAYRMNEQPDPALLVAAAGDYFLGLQVKCAQCHDHPFHEWSQEQFWGMAAMFGRVRLKGQINNGREVEHLLTDADVDPKEMVRMNGIQYADQLPGGKIEIPDPVNPGEVIATVSATLLDGSQPKLPEKGNYRRDFAAWLTAKENPYFARATVNRLWAHFFGRGIVEPIDNLHPDNKPTHPELLDLLADEFKRSDYDVKHLVRCITLSRAYQRTSRPVAGNDDDKTLVSHMAVKPLDSYALVESLWTALSRAPMTGTRRRDAAAEFDTRLPGGDPTKYTHSIPQVLKLMNSKDHLSNPTIQNVTRGKPVDEAIEHLYLAVLARRPSAEESAEMVEYVKQLESEAQGYAEVYWVLLNSAEFLVNH
jgi:chemotaxis protein histidine kinase CheA